MVAILNSIKIIIVISIILCLIVAFSMLFKTAHLDLAKTMSGLLKGGVDVADAATELVDRKLGITKCHDINNGCSYVGKCIDCNTPVEELSITNGEVNIDFVLSPFPNCSDNIVNGEFEKIGLCKASDGTFNKCLSGQPIEKIDYNKCILYDYKTPEGKCTKCTPALKPDCSSADIIDPKSIKCKTNTTAQFFLWFSVFGLLLFGIIGKMRTKAQKKAAIEKDKQKITNDIKEATKTGNKSLLPKLFRRSNRNGNRLLVDTANNETEKAGSSDPSKKITAGINTESPLSTDQSQRSRVVAAQLENPKDVRSRVTAVETVNNATTAQKINRVTPQNISLANKVTGVVNNAINHLTSLPLNKSKPNAKPVIEKTLRSKPRTRVK